MKANLVISTFILLLCTNVMAKPETIVLIRHAEKQVGSNPSLSAKGQKRASAWVSVLAPYSVEQLFSTNYNRTIETITPLAKELKKEVLFYNPAHLLEFKNQLLTLNSAVLVVGHSNTTPILAGLLSDTHQVQWAETNYNTYYVLTLLDDRYVIELKHLAIE